MPAPKGAGDLRQRVKFQRRGEGDDGYGNTATDWADMGIARACSLMPTRGNEAVQAARLSGLASWDIWVRSDSGTRRLQVGDRAINERDASQTFNIVFIGDMDGRRQWLLIQATTGGADG
ncbi:head-tail adaptor protein [Brevundimonas sp.]|uniref:head-tail adaptor protein n=1 Tax=Brevundimonas sp. TaxID=1871086 RepID=UPI002D283590|nr:head-tail adaptor protein [Brevundimonas sp.]HYC66646.1 head-tail adaptor protein [Brevundimonas sp.]